MHSRARRNICTFLRDRETHFKSSPYFYSMQIMKCVVLSDRYNYTKASCVKSTTSVWCKNNLLYTNNWKNCYILCKGKVSEIFFHQQLIGQHRIVDSLFFTPFLGQLKECDRHQAKCTCFKSHIVFLTKDEYLVRCDVRTVEILEKICVKSLEPNTLTSFKYCNSNTLNNQIVLVSTFKKVKTCPSPMMQIAIFETFPLRFYCMFELCPKVFGSACTGAFVLDDLLIVMKKEKLHFMSLLQILDEGSWIPSKARNEQGLTVNLLVNSAPPTLFVLNCFANMCTFGGFPFMCIYPVPDCGNTYQIQTVKDGKIIKTIEITDHDEMGDKVYFHPDNSNRIISQSSKRVDIYKVDHSSKDISLQLHQKCDFACCLDSKRCDFNVYGLSSSGTSCICMDGNVCCPPNQEYEHTVYALYYEDEMELLAILGTFPDLYPAGFVKLYDNVTGQEMKRFDLHVNLDYYNGYSLFIDLDVIIIEENVTGGAYNVLIYFLTPLIPKSTSSRCKLRGYR